MRVVQHIRNKLGEIPLGTPFSSKELIGFGNESNIRKVLERLVKEKEIIRVMRGIYARPKISRFVGPVPPSLEAVLESISSSTGEIFQVHGAEAVRQLGLSTQASVQPIFLTSGRSRTITIGNIEVKLKNVSHRKLLFAGTLAGIGVSALWYLTKEEITLKTIEKIEKALTPEKFNKLLQAKASMPSWVTAVIISYEQQKKTKRGKSKQS